MFEKGKALIGWLVSMNDSIPTEWDNINDFFINKSVLLSDQGRQDPLYQNVYILWTSGWTI